MRGISASLALGATVGLCTFLFTRIPIQGAIIGAVIGIVVTLATRSRHQTSLVMWISAVFLLSYHLPYFFGMLAVVLGIAEPTTGTVTSAFIPLAGSFFFVCWAVALLMESRTAVLFALVALASWATQLDNDPRWIAFAVIYLAIGIRTVVRPQSENPEAHQQESATVASPNRAISGDRDPRERGSRPLNSNR